MAPDGTLYGGNAGDGQLFRLDPATGKVANLGKPAMMPRMQGLAFAGDGKLYGVTGGRARLRAPVLLRACRARLRGLGQSRGSP